MQALYQVVNLYSPQSTESRKNLSGQMSMRIVNLQCIATVVLSLVMNSDVISTR